MYECWIVWICLNHDPFMVHADTSAAPVAEDPPTGQPRELSHRASSGFRSATPITIWSYVTLWIVSFILFRCFSLLPSTSWLIRLIYGFPTLFGHGWAKSDEIVEEFEDDSLTSSKDTLTLHLCRSRINIEVIYYVISCWTFIDCNKFLQINYISTILINILHVLLYECMFDLSMFDLSTFSRASRHGQKEEEPPAAKRCSVQRLSWSGASQRRQSGAVAGQWPGEDWWRRGKNGFWAIFISLHIYI